MIEFVRARHEVWHWLLPGVFVFLTAGCGKRSITAPLPSAGPGPRAPALYGSLTGSASRDISRARPSATNDSSWRQAAFFVLQTELSPAVLVHSTGRHLNLFSDLKSHGLGAPRFVAWSTPNGPRSFSRGAELDVKKMEENWLMVWFAGAEGWTNWDSPWAVFLQHNPSSMRLDDAGLHLSFPEKTGDVVLMPLYGYYKPPRQGQDFLAEHGLPSKKIKTWEWAQTLPREPLTRVRYWSGATREIPIYCEDTFSVDRGKDSVTIRSRFTYYSIRDDWNTKPVRLAPVSPPLGLALKLAGFPVQLSARHFDFDLPTPSGPYVAIEDAESFDATFPVLQYVNETEAVKAPEASMDPTAQAALSRLGEVARAKFQSLDRFEPDEEGLKDVCGAFPGHAWYARALPYYDAPTRSNAVASLRRYFRSDVLITNRSRLDDHPKGPGRDYYVLDDDGVGSADASRDAGRLTANVLEAIWAYAHFTGDWELVRERWPLIKKLFTTPAETRWASFGCDAMANMGDEAAPCVAFARLAYQARDMNSYHYGCYTFARELVHLFLKQRGAGYFRKQQPWHSMEFMDDEVFLTDVRDDIAGWHLDGPNFPTKTDERQFEKRWVRFNDSDVGRFYRDYLQEDVRRELNWLAACWEPKRRWNNDSRLMPSLVQLRSLLLNETPAELAKVATPDRFTGAPSGLIATCASVLRTSHPTRYERLIPGGEPSPFVLGLEREVAGPNPNLVVAVQHEIADKGSKRVLPAWPQLTWPSWKTEAGRLWSFGRVKPVRATEPDSVRVVPLNWNTRVIVYELP
jgi:hypothetical protein